MDHFNLAKPSVFLQPFIKHYWSIENTGKPEDKYVQRIIPSGMIEMIFYIYSRPTILDDTKNFSENVILSGHQKEFYDLQCNGNLAVFSVVFRPEGLMKFFNIPLNELYNKNIPLKFINDRFEQSIHTRILDNNSFQKRIGIIENYLTGILFENINNFEFKRINHAVNIIRQSQGIISIETIASEVCLSRKQFERKFTEYVGATPKQYLKTIRLQLSLFLKARNRALSLTELAFDCGYYDQSHFINEFKFQTGLTPRQYFDNNESYSDFFDDPFPGTMCTL
jgi:AraC-like DNA-binding protein